MFNTYLRACRYVLNDELSATLEVDFEVKLAGGTSLEGRPMGVIPGHV